MPPTKHRIVRLTDEHWNQIIALFRQIVPPERIPAHANPNSDWQVTEGLRMIADGEIVLRIKGRLK